MRNILSIFVLTLLLFSCTEEMNERAFADLVVPEGEMLPEERKSMVKSPAPINGSNNQVEIKKKIIKDGRLGLKVSELGRTKSKVDSLIKIHGGYYANEKLNNSDWESSYILKIRIPSDHFEKFIFDVEKGTGELEYKEIYARDVTDEFIDLETRLENKRSYLKRYKDILKQAKSIKEILEIEEKIRRLEEEINSTTGRLKYMRDLVKYSTLDLTITMKKEFKYNPVKQEKFSERLKLSLSKGWVGSVDFLLWLIKIWPFWIIASAILYFWKKYRKSRG